MNNVKSIANKEVLLKQKRFDMTFFSIWIMFITTVQWIMLDMYLPALPVLIKEFHVSESLLNVSLNAGILFTAIGTLISGILSDRYGRKAILIFGFVMNVAACFGCGAANNVWVMIVMRAFNGLGSGFITTITMTMISDSFSGNRFKGTMTAVQSLAAIGPIFAPAIGSLLINVLSWRYIFILLGAASLISFIPMIFSTETWPKSKRLDLDLGQVLKGAVAMTRNGAFMLFLAIIAMLTIPAWAYLSVSSYVYIDEYGISNTAYGIYYSSGAIASLTAPFIYLILTRIFKVRKVVSVAIGVLLLGGVILLFGGSLAPIIFMFGVIPLMLAEGMIRPLGMIVLLEEFHDQAGTTSAWTNFTINAVGVVGTTLATLSWSSKVTGLWIIATGCVAVAVICWAIIVKNKWLQSSLG